MKKLVIFVSVLLAAFALNSAADEVAWESFEGKNMWKVAPWDNTGISANVSQVKVSEGKWSLKCNFNNAIEFKKAVFSLQEDFDWSGVEILKMDVFNAGTSFLSFSFALCTGGGWQWYESGTKILDIGWNKNIQFSLRERNFKSKESNWQYNTSIANLDNVRRICLSFWDGGGPVYVDNIRLYGENLPQPLIAGEISEKERKLREEGLNKRQEEREKQEQEKLKAQRELEEKARQEALLKAAEQRRLEVVKTAGGVLIRVHVNFASGKSRIPVSQVDDLRAVAEVLREFPEMKVRIEGHTDSVGSSAPNLELSQKRAKSVFGFLVDMYGIERSRLSAVGCGEEKPIASNGTKEGRARNRRVEFVIIQ